MNPVLQQLQAEATRRFGGLGGSSAGTQPNPSASSPLQSPKPAQPATPSAQPAGQPAMPSAQDPFAGAASMLNGAAPTGGTNLEKALIKRMNMYPPA